MLLMYAGVCRKQQTPLWRDWRQDNIEKKTAYSRVSGKKQRTKRENVDITMNTPRQFELPIYTSERRKSRRRRQRGRGRTIFYRETSRCIVEKAAQKPIIEKT